MKYIFIFLLISIINSNVKAVYVSSYIYELGSDESFVSKNIQNNTNNTNLYSISAYPIKKPDNENEIRLQLKDKEVLYAPLRTTIDKSKTDMFKIIYRGPADDKERYYRVIFTETPLVTFNSNEKDRAPLFLPSVSLSTFLIIRPRKINFEYSLDEKKGYIKNTGNTFFRVVIHKGCDGTDQEANQFYILPGEEYYDDAITKENRKLLIFNKKYMQIGEKCLNTESNEIIADINSEK